MTLRGLLQEAILEESASVDDVISAIDGHNRVIINYHTDGKDKADGPRVIEVYAYGITTAGNPVIRAFQPFGDTTTSVPRWKYFRLDRIVEWRPTEQKFTRPASDYYKGLGEFNKNGDKTMATVFKIADFENGSSADSEALRNMATSGVPKLKNNVEKTETERRMERLRQQLNNPIMISDIGKNVDGTSNSGPKLSAKAEREKEKTDDVFKTDTERGMEKLLKQLENPRKIDIPGENDKKEDDKKQNDVKTDDVFRTDTETGMEKLLKQLENPRKIDLTNIPKR